MWNPLCPESSHEKTPKILIQSSIRLIREGLFPVAISSLQKWLTYLLYVTNILTNAHISPLTFTKLFIHLSDFMWVHI